MGADRIDVNGPDGWATNIRARFAEGGDPHFSAVHCLGLRNCLEWFYPDEVVGDAQIEEFIIEVVRSADLSQSGTAHAEARARRAGALGYLLLGDQPNDEDRFVIDRGNSHRYPKGVHDGTKPFRCKF
jgi:hypothetical protein